MVHYDVVGSLLRADSVPIAMCSTSAWAESLLLAVQPSTPVVVSPPAPPAYDPAAGIPWAVGKMVVDDDFTRGIPKAWGTYSGKGGSGGTYTPSTVGSNTTAGLTISAKGDATGGLSRHSAQLRGTFVWHGVACSKVADVPASAGKLNKPCLCLWPEPPAHWEAGEIDVFESSDARDTANATVHWGGAAHQSQQRFAIDVTKAHSYAVGWFSGKILIAIDGVLRFTFASPAVSIPTVPFHPTIQVDGGHGSATLTVKRYAQFLPA